jgi:hypothetical protein
MISKNFTFVFFFLSSSAFKSFDYTGQDKWFTERTMSSFKALVFAASLGHWPFEVYIIICTVCTSCWRTQEGRCCLYYTGKGVGGNKFNNESSGFIF